MAVAEIDGTWQHTKNRDTTILEFKDDSLVIYYISTDTNYAFRCLYTRENDTLRLKYGDRSQEDHYVRWVNEDKFILDPERPDDLAIPAIDLLKFERVTSNPYHPTGIGDRRESRRLLD